MKDIVKDDISLRVVGRQRLKIKKTYFCMILFNNNRKHLHLIKRFFDFKETVINY